MVTSDPTGNFLLEGGVTLGLVALVDFISLGYNNNAMERIPMNAIPLLTDLLHFLSLHVGTLALRVSLLNCMVRAVGQCKASQSGAPLRRNTRAINTGAGTNEGLTEGRPRKIWDDEDVYNLALNVAGTSIELVGQYSALEEVV